jgi:hypothetical protein
MLKPEASELWTGSVRVFRYELRRPTSGEPVPHRIGGVKLTESYLIGEDLSGVRRA